MKYKKPNIKAEWPEALRYRLFERMGYSGWSKLVMDGKPVSFSRLDNVGNVDLDYEKLEEDKKERFEDAYESGVIEYPIVAKFKKNRFELIAGNTRVAGLLDKGVEPKVWLIDTTNDDDNEPMKHKNHHDLTNELWVRDEDPVGDNLEDSDDDDDDVKKPKPKPKPKPKKDVKETDSSSAGAFVAPFGGKPAVIKRPLGKIPNFMNEALDSSVSAGAAFDVPFGGGGTKGRKNPLKIDGTKSIYKNRAVKDKKFPRFGGPDAVFVKIKEKCKKFPYCNQGDQGNLEFLHEDQEFKAAITKAAEMYGIPYADVEKIVINEIKKIFI